MKPNRKIVTKIITDELIKSGVVRKQSMLFSYDNINEKISGWLGLNTAIYNSGKVISVNPVVGFIHKDVQDLAVKLTDNSYKKNQPPLLAQNIGYIMPTKEYIDWEFDGSKKDVHSAEEISENVTKYGIPWINSVSDLEVCLQELIYNKKGMPGQREYKIPIVLHFLGRSQEGWKFIEDFKSEMIERNTHREIFERYEKFSIKFTDMVNQSK